ncbi:MAG: MinD/ParA family protein [Zetaproteobacteria bacterium]|nr:MAG: MinD/ParA family protein [Zetaproteobacteria bacterium]
MSAMSPPPRIWAVAGGKGGVGKSITAASLGLALAREGKRVALIDLDLGGANLHTCLGLPPSATLFDFLNQHESDINAFVTATRMPRIGLISSATQSLDIVSLKHFQKQRILRNLKHIAADYVILDLGAGCDLNTLDFFLAAERGIIVVTPDPTSIENAYRFLKSALVRRMRELPPAARAAINELLLARRKQGAPALESFAALLERVRRQQPSLGDTLAATLTRQRIHLLVNQVHEPADIELGHAMSLAGRRYFAQALEYLGHLHYDRQVGEALRRKQPLLEIAPTSRAAIQFVRLARTLLNQEQPRGAIDERA